MSQALVTLENVGVAFNAQLRMGSPRFWALEDVSLELRAGDRLDGHLVSGHVDGVGTVTRFDRAGESSTLAVAAPPALARFLALKGSIAVDGVSLTVNRVVDAAAACEFMVNLIPHTVEQTTLRGLIVGRKVNLEVDLMARYAARLMERP